jgi:hypothetical protein
MANKVTTDVDIDVFGREKILQGLNCVFGRIDRPEGKFELHKTGVYFQNIPRDPTTNISTIDHKVANEYGYFKIDFLNVNMYEGIKNEAHLNLLINREPPWDFFDFPEITDKLFHLNGYSHLLQKYKPQSVEDIAMILAIIRPSKAYLQQSSWDEIRKQVWVKEDDGIYGFKKSHAISYGLAIVVNLNLLLEDMSREM